MSALMNKLMDVISQNHFVVLDTETTGLGELHEIVQIALIDFQGDELLSSYAKPRRPIPAEATNIHGISDDTVANAPVWSNLREKVFELCQGKDVIIYNADFDLNMLQQTDRYHGFNSDDWEDACRFHCAMKAYAEFWGDWNDYRRSYRWQKLGAAVTQQQVDASQYHDALGDAQMTYRLLMKIRATLAQDAIVTHEDGHLTCKHERLKNDVYGIPVCAHCGYRFG